MYLVLLLYYFLSRGQIFAAAKLDGIFVLTTMIPLYNMIVPYSNVEQEEGGGTRG